MMDDLLQEMIDPAPVHHDVPRRRRLWTTVAIVGLAAVGATTLTTSALFTDRDSTSSDIRSGTVDLTVDSAAVFDMDTTGLAPGSSTYVPITVTNDGSLQLRYSVRFAAADAELAPIKAPAVDDGDTPTGAFLGDILELSLYENGATCNASTTTAANQIATPRTGWTTGAQSLIGDATEGPQGGDRILDGGGATETLCARVDFPRDAPNAYQGSAVKLSLTFDAEQTLNNTPVP
jgi:spore coat-associated protein N